MSCFPVVSQAAALSQSSSADTLTNGAIQLGSSRTVQQNSQLQKCYVRTQVEVIIQYPISTALTEKTCQALQDAPLKVAKADIPLSYSDGYSGPFRKEECDTCPVTESLRNKEDLETDDVGRADLSKENHCELYANCTDCFRPDPDPLSQNPYAPELRLQTIEA